MNLALRGLGSDRADVRKSALGIARSSVPLDLLFVFDVLSDGDEGAEGRTRGTQEPPGLPSLLSYPEPFLRELVAEFLVVHAADRYLTEGMPMLTAIEKLMFLRAVPIFRSVPLEDLRPWSRIL